MFTWLVRVGCSFPACQGESVVDPYTWVAFEANGLYTRVLTDPNSATPPNNG